MKKHSFLALLVFLPLLFSYNYHEYEPYTAYSPILMTREQLNSSVRFEAPQKMSNPGKIYLKGSALYIVEKFKGIHVVNNSDRANPQKIGFIQVPGCVDLAIKGSNLYVDNAVDLVTIDISRISELKVTERISNVFPELVPPDIEYVPSMYSKDNRPDGTVIIAWLLKE